MGGGVGASEVLPLQRCGCGGGGEESLNHTEGGGGHNKF